MVAAHQKIRVMSSDQFIPLVPKLDLGTRLVWKLSFPWSFDHEISAAGPRGGLVDGVKVRGSYLPKCNLGSRVIDPSEGQLQRRPRFRNTDGTAPVPPNDVLGADASVKSYFL